MHILLIGQGAREHALAWKLSRSRLLSKLSLYPANALSRSLGEVFSSDSLSVEQIVDRCSDLGVDLVVIGPEGPLAEGLVDRLEEQGIQVFGPKRMLARLESSKSFAKELMQRAGIPTAAYQVCSCEGLSVQARTWLEKYGAVVIKVDGLAAGKGVFVSHSVDDIARACTAIKKLPQSSRECIVLEEFLHGRECSFFAMLGQRDPVSLGFAVDFKRAFDLDVGPNTGGMGAYTPVPWLPSDAQDRVNKEILKPLIAALSPSIYCGFLYVGLMWTDSGPRVVEFNVRLGDPEAQVLAVADDSDWLQMIAWQLGIGEQSSPQRIDSKPTVGVVMSSQDYPFSRQISDDQVEMQPGELSDLDSHFFAAAVKQGPAGLTPGAGRVATLVASDGQFSAARAQVYRDVDQVSKVWSGLRWRGDIAQKACEGVVGGSGR